MSDGRQRVERVGPEDADMDDAGANAAESDKLLSADGNTSTSRLEEIVVSASVSSVSAEGDSARTPSSATTTDAPAAAPASAAASSSLGVCKYYSRISDFQTDLRKK